MAKDFKVTIHNPEWQAILGTTTVCVKTPIRQWADLPGKPNALIYKLDVAQLEPYQLTALISHLANKFGLSLDETTEDVIKRGVPILADDCVVIIEHPQRWL